MRTIYETNEWKGYIKQNYYWYEYRTDESTVYKFKCHRQKFFDGNENTWINDEDLVDSWDINDDCMPKWIKNIYSFRG
ncbi:hypothetical protein SD457_10160 [Coprobacillaceae bacterium CR2/5/TPMF4]|nr:hypothetical protein SD457_10160 [Coprobacillaceae bacterium CR2/5/TPMF4]